MENLISEMEVLEEPVSVDEVVEIASDDLGEVVNTKTDDGSGTFARGNPLLQF